MVAVSSRRDQPGAIGGHRPPYVHGHIANKKARRLLPSGFWVDYRFPYLEIDHN